VQAPDVPNLLPIAEQLFESMISLKAHPTFEDGDGLLAGLLAAQVALRAGLHERARER
jgi:hypothetical protein